MFFFLNQIHHSLPFMIVYKLHFHISRIKKIFETSIQISRDFHSVTNFCLVSNLQGCVDATKCL